MGPEAKSCSKPFIIGQLFQGKSKSTTKAANCRDPPRFERVPRQSLPPAFLLEQVDKRQKMLLTFLSWEAVMIYGCISPPAEWIILIESDLKYQIKKIKS